MANKNMFRQRELLSKAKEIETVKKGNLIIYSEEYSRNPEAPSLTARYKSQKPRISVLERQKQNV